MFRKVQLPKGERMKPNRIRIGKGAVVQVRGRKRIVTGLVLEVSDKMAQVRVPGSGVYWLKLERLTPWTTDVPRELWSQLLSPIGK